jgi:Ca2+-binding RTX toxin-like protein
MKYLWNKRNQKMATVKFTGTAINEIINVNNSQPYNYYNGGAGDDVFVISSKLTKNIEISDATGTNKINLPNGIVITKAIFSVNGVQYTLSSGVTITINSKNADNLKFVFGDLDQDADISTSVGQTAFFAATVTKTFAETAAIFGIDATKLVAGAAPTVSTVSMTVSAAEIAIAVTTFTTPSTVSLTYTISGDTITGSTGVDVIDVSMNTNNLILTGLAGDDDITTGSGDDIVRAGDGKDTVKTNAGNDVIVVVGQTAANQYIASDIYNPGGTGIDLSNVISLSDLNNRVISEVVAGESIDGGTGINRLVIYGNVDFTGVTLSNVSQFQVNSTVTISAEQLNALGLTAIFGDREGESVLNITNPGNTPVTFDLSSITFEQFRTLNISSGVTVIVDQADVDSLHSISGEGTIKAATTALNLANKQINVVVQDKDGNVDATHGGGVYVEGKLLVGSESADALTGAEKSDRLEGSAGNDTLIGADGNDVLRGGAGVDSMDGGAGNDSFVVVGDISGGGKKDSDADTAALGFKLTTLNGINLNEDEDGAIETIRGGDGDDTLYVYGTADLSKYDITGIEHIEIRSNVTFSVAQLQSIHSLNGDGNSTVGISSGVGSTQLDLSTLTLSQLGQISVGENVTLLTPSIAALGGATTLSGTGNIRATTGTLDLNGITQVSSLNVRNADETLPLGAAKIDKVFLSEEGEKETIGSNGDDSMKGSYYDDTISGGDGADHIYGLGGDDILCGDERFVELFDPNVVTETTTAVTTTTVASNSLVNGLGGDSGFGEKKLDPGDDRVFAAVDITPIFGEKGLNFFGTQFTSLYVNNNGNITFQSNFRDYTPTEINAGLNNPIIAAFWADVDTSGSAPNTSTPGGNSTGSNRVWYDLDTDKDIFTVTWDDVGYFGGTNKLNAFQLQLINTGESNFDIVFRYENVEWTIGDADGGSNGLSNNPDAKNARAGYSSGNGKAEEILKTITQDAMLNLETTKQDPDKPEGVFSFTVWDGHTHKKLNADTLVGGAGNDTLLGGIGDDIAMYGGVKSDYDISFKGTTMFIKDKVSGRDGDDVVMPSVEYLKFLDGEVKTSTLSPNLVNPDKRDFIEDLIGTDFDDKLTGNGLDNYLDGGYDGNDTLTGLEGDDILVGDWGNDTAVYRGNMADYTIEEYADEDAWEIFWVVTDNNTTDGNDGMDFLYSIEFLQFADVAKHELPVTDLFSIFGA